MSSFNRFTGTGEFYVTHLADNRAATVSTHAPRAAQTRAHGMRLRTRGLAAALAKHCTG
ncbi:MAG: hypothetical protein ACFB03_14800 [Paracoccaceae bacterium]